MLAQLLSSEVERDLKEPEVFSKEREETWTRQGIRYGHQSGQQSAHQETELSPEQLTRMVDDHNFALDQVLHITRVTREVPSRSKESFHRFWLAFKAVYAFMSKQIGLKVKMDVVHPALGAAFEASYPQKQPDHKELLAIDFAGFLDYGMSGATFAKITSQIEEKILELIRDHGSLSELLETSEKRSGLIMASMPPNGG